MLSVFGDPKKVTVVAEIDTDGVRIRKTTVYLPEEIAQQFAVKIFRLQLHGHCIVRPFTAGLGWVAESVK